MRTETREEDIVSSSESCLTSSAGGAGATVHRYSFFVVNAILQCGNEQVHYPVRECIFHSQMLNKAELYHRFVTSVWLPISRILSALQKQGRQSFICKMHYCILVATYPFRLNKELSGLLSFRKDGKRNLRGLALSGVCRVTLKTPSLLGPMILLPLVLTRMAFLTSHDKPH